MSSQSDLDASDLYESTLATLTTARGVIQSLAVDRQISAPQEIEKLDELDNGIRRVSSLQPDDFARISFASREQLGAALANVQAAAGMLFDVKAFLDGLDELLELLKRLFPPGY